MAFVKNTPLYTNTPWGRTSAWMQPPKPSLYTTTNPWAALSTENGESTWRCDATPTEYNPPPYGHMLKIPCMVYPELMGYVIGKNGVVFKAITHQVSGGMYIWYHKDQGMIEIWGDNKHALEGMKERVTDHMLRIQYERMPLQVSGDWASVEDDGQ